MRNVEWVWMYRQDFKRILRLISESHEALTAERRQDDASGMALLKKRIEGACQPSSSPPPVVSLEPPTPTGINNVKPGQTVLVELTEDMPLSEVKARAISVGKRIKCACTVTQEGDKAAVRAHSYEAGRLKEDGSALDFLDPGTFIHLPRIDEKGVQHIIKAAMSRNTDRKFAVSVSKREPGCFVMRLS